jgi:hypothetical protein
MHVVDSGDQHAVSGETGASARHNNISRHVRATILDIWLNNPIRNTSRNYDVHILIDRWWGTRG